MHTPGLPGADHQAFCLLRGQGLSPKVKAGEQGFSLSVRTCLAWSAGHTRVRVTGTGHGASLEENEESGNG